MKYNRKILAGAIGAGIVLGFRTTVHYRRRFDFAGATVLITGGSRGLGLVLARHLLRQGARPVLIARDETELRDISLELNSTDLLTMVCDVRDRNSIEETVIEIIRMRGKIDVLMNNAGIIQVGPREHMHAADFQNAMNVHFWGPFYTMLAVIPGMLERGSGRIVNIASIGGKVAVPHLLPYSASKFALVGLSDGIRAELRQHGIYVTTVCPGLMRTGSHFNIDVKGRHPQEFAWFAVSAGTPLISMNADRAASKILKACRIGRASLDLGWSARAAIVANAVTPSLFGEAMAMVNQLLPPPASMDAPRSGWESRSEWAPSRLTRLADKAVPKNNELKGHSPAELELKK